WAWGTNLNGQLGNGSTDPMPQPVQQVNITGVVEIAAGPYFSVAKKSDGSVWTWGYNEYGQLGDGTNINRYLPVTIKENEAPSSVVIIAPNGTQSTPTELNTKRPSIGWNQFDDAFTVFDKFQVQILN